MAFVFPGVPAEPSTSAKVSTTGRHIPALDGVRGLAILLVFAVHFLWSSEYHGHNPFMFAITSLRNIGWLGVNLFFVLSGFLITGILYDTRQSHRFFRNFYARRALRIFPLYYASIALGLTIVFLERGTFQGTELLKLLTYTRNLGLGVSGPVVSIPEIQFNHFWTLAIEEQFYLIWPMLVFALQTRRRIAMAAAAGILISILTRMILIHTNLALPIPYLLKSWTPANLDGLCWGALLSLGIRSSYENKILRGSRAALLLGFISLALISWKNPSLDTLQPEHGRAANGILLLCNLTFAAMIAVSLQLGSWLQRFFTIGLMRFFGRYSYGLYIFHYSIADLTLKYRSRFIEHLHSKVAGGILCAAVGILASILLAVLSFHCFEAPLLGFKRFFTDQTPTPLS